MILLTKRKALGYIKDRVYKQIGIVCGLSVQGTILFECVGAVITKSIFHWFPDGRLTKGVFRYCGVCITFAYHVYPSVERVALFAVTRR